MRCKVAVRYSNTLFAIPIKFNAISSHLKTISCEKLNRLSTPIAVPGDVANRKVEPEQGRRPNEKSLIANNQTFANNYRQRLGLRQ